MNDGYVIGRDEKGLTRREREVMDLLRRGQSRNQVADDLGISRQRVAQILESIGKKGVDPSEYAARRGREAAAEDKAAGIVPDEL